MKVIYYFTALPILALCFNNGLSAMAEEISEPKGVRLTPLLSNPIQIEKENQPFLSIQYTLSTANRPPLGISFTVEAQDLEDANSAFQSQNIDFLRLGDYVQYINPMILQPDVTYTFQVSATTSSNAPWTTSQNVLQFTREGLNDYQSFGIVIDPSDLKSIDIQPKEKTRLITLFRKGFIFSFK